MSYESKGFWVLKNNEHTTSDEDSSVYDHSTTTTTTNNSSKRPNPWFVDPSRSEILPNKKQTVQQDRLPLWESSFMDRLLGTEMPPRPLLFGDREANKTIRGSYMDDTGVELSISNGKLPVSRVKESLDGKSLSSSCNNRESTENSFVNFTHHYGNEDSSNGITFGDINDGSSNYRSYIQDPIGTSDLVYEQEETVVSEEQQTVKPSLELESLPKKEAKTAKKEASTSFPSNVRSLISTGMLDGVPVKYISLSREELRGVIKGSGYLCGCESCDFTKVLNAYAFERHAGCKTKHPNNHIYFENGKTIYQIVQELRSTSESMLFDVIQTVFGSPINQKAFRIWKESFQAATRELQRIYGKEERCF